MGPKARAILEAATGQDLPSQGFPFGQCRELKVAGKKVRALRVTYVGELGWELYVPAESALHVFERLMAAGESLGLKPAGFYAMNACRMEKGYRHWGHDIGIEDTPVEAGLVFTCAWDKPGGFVGREAVLAQRALGVPNKRLVQFRLADPTQFVHHEEPIFANGEPVGSVTSGRYGHRVDASLAMGYVTRPHPITPEWIAATRFEIAVGARRVPVQAGLGAWYDPTQARIRG